MLGSAAPTLRALRATFAQRGFASASESPGVHPRHFLKNARLSRAVPRAQRRSLALRRIASNRAVSAPRCVPRGSRSLTSRDPERISRVCELPPLMTPPRTDLQCPARLLPAHERLERVRSASRAGYVIFGASGGIGSALAARLLQHPGASVLLCGRDEGKLQELAERIGGGTPCVADVSDLKATEEAIARAEKEFGNVVGVANCVGSLILKSAHATSPKEVRLAAPAGPSPANAACS